jgi:ADP-ribosyl-[dinitrogen reductase] hydrolase
VDACRYLSALLVGALEGRSKGDLVAGDYFTAAETPEIGAVAAGSFRAKEPPAIRGSGYVVESLEAALWAFDRSSSFEEGALLAVNLGNDADTTGAVFGQLGGAHYGEAGIPQRWREKLAMRETIENFADRLFEAPRFSGRPRTT